MNKHDFIFVQHLMCLHTCGSPFNYRTPRKKGIKRTGLPGLFNKVILHFINSCFSSENIKRQGIVIVLCSSESS